MTKQTSIAPVLITVGIALVVYSLTLAPDLTWANFGTDGGDLITAAYTLGIPHPSGYPTYVILSKLFSLLPLDGPIAYRFNLFSAVTIATAAGFITATMHHLSFLQRQESITPPAPSREQAVSIATGLIFAFSSLIWSQATITEVYGLNLMFLSALLWALWGKQPFWITGLLLGLSITTHLTSVLMLPFALWIVGNQTRWQLRKALTLLVWMLIGLTPFLLVFWLAQGDSPVKWGNPTQLKQWGWLISAKIYKANLFHVSQIQLRHRMITWGWTLLKQFTLLGLPLIILGWVESTKDKQSSSFTIEKAGGLTAVIFIIYAIGYSTKDAIIFLLPALLLFTPLLALGLHNIGKLSLILPVALLLLNFNEQNLSNDIKLRVQAMQLFQSVPTNAIILTPGDATIFALWYFQHVEAQREDLILIDSNLLAFEWYRHQMKQQYPQLVSLEKDDLDSFQQYNSALRPLCTITLVDPLNSESISNSCRED